ncbi:MAG: NAD-dependent epimerase/dehydratase family protein [bacterium]
MPSDEHRADLVIGGRGFLGSAIARRLTDSGRAFKILARRSSNAPPAGSDPNIIEGDVNATKLLPAWLKETATVYFAVPITDLGEDPGDWNGVPFLAACAEAGVRVVVATDISLYTADTTPPHDEKTNFQGRTSVGDAQMEWENSALLEGLRRRFAVTVLRFPALVGAGLTNAAWRDTFARVQSGRTLDVVGRGEEVTELLHVDDAARACILAATRIAARGEIIQIPGHPIRRKNLLRVLIKVAESKSEIVSVADSEENAKKRRRHAPAHLDSWVRGEKARRLLGFTPEISYERAFRETLASLAAAAARSR